MSIKILIEVSRDQQIEIENICSGYGKTFSEYFLDLHRKEKKNDSLEKCEKTDLGIQKIESKEDKKKQRK